MNTSSFRSIVVHARPSILYLCLAALAATWSGCGSASTSVVAPTAQKCQISVTDFTRTFGAAGGSGSASVTAARECTWTAVAGASWLSFPTGSQGTGDGKLTFSVAPNPVAQGRSTALTVNTQNLTVSQDPAPCRYSVSPASLEAAALGGTYSLAVSATTGCNWTASTTATWLDLLSAGGSGAGTISITVAANNGDSRSTTILAAGQAVPIVQAASTGGPAPGCQYSVTPSSLSFPAAGGAASLKVTTAPKDCPWQATTLASWLTLAPETGSGPGEIGVTAAPNTSTTALATTIQVGGQSVAVSQDAAVPATPVQLIGDLSKVRGDCPTLSFRVDGTPVMTNAATVFVNTECGGLRNGMTVTVDGSSVAGGTVVATRVTRN